jgi:hypothetical protein
MALGYFCVYLFLFYLIEWEEFCMATTKKRNKTLQARLNKKIPSIFKSKSKRGF